MRIVLFVLLTLIFLSPFRLFSQDSIAFNIVSDSSALVISDFAKGLNRTIYERNDLETYNSSSLAELLNRENGIYIKHYGAGLLATATHRGGNAAQTAVLWEGMNILNPMLGQSDLSLLPVNFIDNAVWQSGGSSALSGNNAIGGSLHLKSNSEFNSGFKASGLFQTGSFGEFKQHFNLRYGNSKYAGSLRSFYQRAENNYLFRDLNAFGNPKPMMRLSNAAQESWGLLFENKIKLRGSEISWKHWYQQSYREIPPNLLQTAGDKENQFDNAFRNSLRLKKIFSGSILTFDAGLIVEKLYYRNNVISSLSRTISTLARVSQQFFKGKHQFQWLSEYQFQKAFSDNYNKGQHLISVAFFYSYEKNHSSFNMSIREQLVNQRFLLPALGFNFKSLLSERYLKTYFNSSLSQNYRFPTLNDRYWPVGGNPELKPEYSWSGDIKISSIKEFRSLSINFDVGAYANFVKNWIQWSPGDFGYWEPENLSRVLAYGPETSLNLKFRLKGQQINLKTAYQMNAAKKLRDNLGNNEVYQLIYTPVHNLNSGLDWNWKFISFRYRHNYFSRRYIDNSNTDWLNPYHIGWAQIRYILNLKNLKISSFLTCDNIWGEEYQTVANRPMPLRMFSIGISINN